MHCNQHHMYRPHPKDGGRLYLHFVCQSTPTCVHAGGSSCVLQMFVCQPREGYPSLWSQVHSDVDVPQVRTGVPLPISQDRGTRPGQDALQTLTLRTLHLVVCFMFFRNLISPSSRWNVVISSFLKVSSRWVYKWADIIVQNI